jgi:hypothetical protein
MTWDEKVLHTFLSFMAGATIVDWLALLHFPFHQQSVYVLDTQSNQVHHPGAYFQFPSDLDGSFPWNVILLLGRYHRKHIFLSNRRPKLDLVNKSIFQFTNRFIWQWFFSNHGNAGLQHSFKVKAKHVANANSLKSIPGNLKSWIGLFTRQARHLFLRSLRRTKHRLKFHSNILRLDVDALKWIQNSIWLPVATDKDGGYCLVPRHHIIQTHVDILSKKWYHKLDSSLDTIFRTACKQYHLLAHRIEKQTEHQGIASHILSSLRSCSAKDLPRKLSLTIKTHKAAGSITCRNLHVGGIQPFGGLSSWLSHAIKSYLRNLKHILTNSAQLASHFRSAVYARPFKFLRIDLKEFFMAGSLQDFCRCIDLFPEVQQSMVKDVITFLVSHQFVQTPVKPADLWQVISGSGMGLIHSSELCDITFYRCVEHRLVTNCLALNSFGIFEYFRFRDDILILYDAEANRMPSFIKLLRLKAKYVDLEVVTVSSYKITMLDLQLHAVPKDGLFGVSFMPHFKPTSLQTPLSCLSAHHTNVHVSWPFSCIRNLARLSSNYSIFARAKEQFVQRFVLACEPEFLIKALIDFNPWPIIHKMRCQQPILPVPVKWIVVPYHPIWLDTRIQHQMNDLVQSSLSLALLKRVFGAEFNFRIRVAWQNCAMHARQIFTHLNDVNSDHFFT